MGDPHKALSLWEPWASLVVWGLKLVETRSWQTRYRGRLWIHATQRADFGGIGVTSARYRTMADALAGAGMLCECGCPGAVHSTAVGCLRCACLRFTPRWRLGHVLGHVELVDVVPTAWCRRDRAAMGWRDDNLALDRSIAVDARTFAFGDFRPGRFAWLLAAPALLDPPVAARGHQQLWEWSGADQRR